MANTTGKDGLSKQNINLEYVGKCSLNIGDYLYGISNDESLEVNERCTICDGTEKVTIKERQFDCPNCKNDYYSHRKATSVRINNYIVRKFKIYRFEYRISDESYQPKKDMAAVEFSAFSKKVTGDKNQRLKTTFRPQNVCVEEFESYKDFQKYLIEKHEERTNAGSLRFTYNDMLFKNHKSATIVADELNTAEQERLKIFNEEHNTAYETNFKQKHDKPFIPPKRRK